LFQRQPIQAAGRGSTILTDEIFRKVATVILTHSDVLEVREAPGKGRGVFARQNIAKGTIFERVPLLIFDTKELEPTALWNYVFIWTKKTVAVALGYGSLYNHSYSPNARYYDGRHKTKVFMAIRDIKAGEEITVNYNGVPTSKTKLHFDVIEDGEKSVASKNGEKTNVAVKVKKRTAATKTRTKSPAKSKTRA
jgi:SET domain-containing protein